MRSPLLLPLLVCMAMLSLGGSARAESVDLTAYLAPMPAPGDFRTYVWSDDGTESVDRYDVTSVDGVGPGWRVGWARGGSGVSTHAELVRPGARVRRATVDDSTPPGCRRAVHYDLRTCDLRMRIGQKRPFQFGYLDSDYNPGFPFPFPTRYHWAQFRGTYVAKGFEPIETPYASHASALKLTAVVREYRASVQRDGWKVVSRGPLRFQSVETRQSWYVEGVGIVALRVTPGPPRDTATSAPTLEMWLKDGLVQGLPYP